VLNKGRGAQEGKREKGNSCLDKQRLKIRTEQQDYKNQQQGKLQGAHCLKQLSLR